MEVDGSHTGGLGAVHGRNDPLLAGHVAEFPDGVEQAGTPGDVAEENHFRLRRKRFLEQIHHFLFAPRRTGNVNLADLYAEPPGAPRPWLDARDVLIRGHEYFVPGLHADSVRDDAQPLRRVPGKHHFLLVRPQKPGGRLPACLHFVPESGPSFAAGLRQIHVPVVDRLRDRLGTQPEGPVIQIDGIRFQVKLRADLLPVGFVVDPGGRAGRRCFVFLRERLCRVPHRCRSDTGRRREAPLEELAPASWFVLYCAVPYCAVPYCAVPYCAVRFHLAEWRFVCAVGVAIHAVTPVPLRRWIRLPACSAAGCTALRRRGPWVLYRNRSRMKRRSATCGPVRCTGTDSR